ncbi:hypothetical protein EJ02DRAFT_410749 [Clathrospora elynae]|uniref:Uncharacterized protein n=1 Tax=Clathrospora elynae TaxID=706981 RepID=A0A6A5SCA6_9PLEO|nr:hypothetical protein EJ02DRAFT_410749 [Clathrospora elynae]
MANFNASSDLPLQLPNPRFSFDFANYAVEDKPCATTRQYIQDLFPGQNKPLPRPNTSLKRSWMKRTAPSPQQTVASLSRELSNRQEDRIRNHAYRQKDRELCPTPTSPHYKPHVDASARSSNSSTSTNTSLGGLQCVLQPVITALNRGKQTASLPDLPELIMEHILAYVVGGPRIVYVTPHQQRHGYYDGSSKLDIRLFLMQPIFSISQQLRRLALDVFYRECTLMIDLYDDEMRKHYQFWTTSPPETVSEAIHRVSRLRIRLPVPSIETAAHRGVANGMEAPKEYIHAVQDCLRAIIDLITDTRSIPPPPKSHPLSPPHTSVLRRKLSFRSIKQPSGCLEFTCRGQSPPPPPNQRKALERLEIVLVKRSETVVILPETLELVAMWKPMMSIEYYIELQGRERLWAKRVMGVWMGREPDGRRLLHVTDLQALKAPPSAALQPRAPQVPTQTREVQNPQERIVRKTTSELCLQQRSAQDERDTRNDHVKLNPKSPGFLPRATVMKGKREPPSVEGLQHITADIRRGVY